MYCRNCGKEIPSGVKFCPECGTAVDPVVDAKPEPNEEAVSAEPELSEEIRPEEASTETAGEASDRPKKPRKKTTKQMMKQGEKISENIILCADGKYRWVYEVNLFKNLTFFFMVWKIFLFIFLGIFTFVTFIELINGGNVLGNIKAMGIALVVMTAVVALGYLLYAAIMGGKYCVIFELDDRGINHKQVSKQAKKAQTISRLTIMAGLLAGNLTTVGVGMNSANTEMYTEFAKVKKVKAFRKKGLIKLREILSNNQVYVFGEDMDFVSKYILDRCVNAKKEIK